MWKQLGPSINSPKQKWVVPLKVKLITLNQKKKKKTIRVWLMILEPQIGTILPSKKITEIPHT
jgi:hypothetical protein